MNENTSSSVKPKRFPNLVVGSGRLAKHIQHYFNLLNVPYLQWSRRAPADLAQLLLQVDKVLLLISDTALAEFSTRQLADFNGPVVHMSGALVVPKTTWVHPLMTFGDELYELDFYKKIGFAAPSTEALATLLPEIPNPSFVISDSAKPLYHAWAVIGGNLMSLLAAETIQELGRLQVPSNITKLYLEKSMSNVFEKGRSAVTGPLMRKDLATIQKNMKALNEDEKKLYAAFVQKFAPEVQL